MMVQTTSIYGGHTYDLISSFS